MPAALIRSFFDPATSTVTHVVADAVAGRAVVVDPVLAREPPAPVPRLPGQRARAAVGQQRRDNVHVHDGITEAGFVAMRTARDRTLAKPVLLLPAIQVNVRAGQWPPAEANGTRYLKIPLNAM